MSDELKPCPWCGDACEVIANSPTECWAACRTTDCPGYGLDRDGLPHAEAIAAWNRRAEGLPPEWERLSCARCGKDCPVYVPKGNPNMEVCPRCHYETTLESLPPRATGETPAEPGD